VRRATANGTDRPAGAPTTQAPADSTSTHSTTARTRHITDGARHSTDEHTHCGSNSAGEAIAGRIQQTSGRRAHRRRHIITTPTHSHFGAHGPETVLREATRSTLLGTLNKYGDGQKTHGRWEDFHLIARECNVNRLMYMSTGGRGGHSGFPANAEIYRRFTKSADRVPPAGADL